MDLGSDTVPRQPRECTPAEIKCSVAEAGSGDEWRHSSPCSVNHVTVERNASSRLQGWVVDEKPEPSFRRRVIIGKACNRPSDKAAKKSGQYGDRDYTLFIHALCLYAIIIKTQRRRAKDTVQLCQATYGIRGECTCSGKRAASKGVEGIA